MTPMYFKSCLLAIGAASAAVAGTFAFEAMPVAPESEMQVVRTHSVVLERDLALYAEEADLIVVGEVGKIGAPKRVKEFDREGMPDTVQRNALVYVDEVIKGNPSMVEMTVTVQGGQVGNLRVFAEDAADLSQGDDVLLFIGTNGRGEHVVFAGQNGRYFVGDDGRVTGAGGYENTIDQMRDELAGILDLRSF